MTYRSEYDVYGFRKSEILPFLEKHKIILNMDQGEHDGVAPQVESPVQWPAWTVTMARRKRLSVVEIICLLAGMDPDSDLRNLGYGGVLDSAYYAHEAIVREALDDGDLPYEVRTVSVNSKPEDECQIAAVDFAAWCEHSDIPWPLPWNFERTRAATDHQLMQQNTDLRHKLNKAEVEIKRLKVTISRLQAESAPAQSIQPALETQSDGREKLLKKHIAMLALLLASQANKYRVGEKPNASQIAQAVTALLEELPDISRHGLGNSSIRQSIGEGIRLLE